MRFDDVFDEAQAETASVDLSFEHFSLAEEWIKDVVDIRWRNSNSTVAHRDNYVRVVRSLNGVQSNPTAFTTVLHSIRNQVFDSPGNCARVGTDQWQTALNILIKYEAAFPELRIAGIDGLFNDLRNANGPHLIDLLAALSARYFEDLLY